MSNSEDDYFKSGEILEIIYYLSSLKIIIMRYPRYNKDLFINNRSAFVKKMQTDSIAVFFSNDILPTNADGSFPFRQNNDLFYLTGIDQEDTILVLCPGHKEEKYREILFIKDIDDNTAIWEGNKLTHEEAAEISGIQSVSPEPDFKNTFDVLVRNNGKIYLNNDEFNRTKILTKNQRFVKWCKRNYPIHQYERSSPLISRLRAIKSSHEIEMITKACEVTRLGFLRAIKAIKPGIMEYEIEAEFAFEFLRNGSRGFAYEPIVASGDNSCFLHYIKNDKSCRENEIVLMDIGAEFGNYNADMTRCVPVNGKFTARQKAVYHSVLKILKTAKTMLKPGILLKDYNTEIGKLMETELVKLRLLDKTEIKNQSAANPLYKKYFMHSISHHLGLDVHDTVPGDLPLKTGMVLTVEPGIYIKEEGLGIRLENDVVIGRNGVTDLMDNIPIEINEIESLMNK